jgi:hypothetical protein
MDNDNSRLIVSIIIGACLCIGVPLTLLPQVIALIRNKSAKGFNKFFI